MVAVGEVGPIRIDTFDSFSSFVIYASILINKMLWIVISCDRIVKIDE